MCLSHILNYYSPAFITWLCLWHMIGKFVGQHESAFVWNRPMKGFLRSLSVYFLILCENEAQDILPWKKRAFETFKLLSILALSPAASALLLNFCCCPHGHGHGHCHCHGHGKFIKHRRSMFSSLVSVKLRIVCKTLSQIKCTEILAQPSISACAQLVSIYANARRNMPASWYVPTCPHTCQACDVGQHTQGHSQFSVWRWVQIHVKLPMRANTYGCTLSLLIRENIRKNALSFEQVSLALRCFPVEAGLGGCLSRCLWQSDACL